MTILENSSVHEWLQTATIPRTGVATAVGRLRMAYERVNGPINRSVFLAELGRCGCRLVGVGSCVLVADRFLPDDGSATNQQDSGVRGRQPAGACVHG